MGKDKKMNIQYSIHRKTNAFIYYLFLLILTIGGGSCKNDNEDIIDKPNENDKTEIYYYLNDEKQIISSNDTLSLKLKSTLTVYINSVHTPQLYAQSPINILDNNNSSYDCYARELALSGVMIIWNNNTESMTFYIKILPLNIYFYVGETNFIVNVTDEILKEVIQDELIKNYIPNYSAIKLSYKTLYDGDLSFVHDSEERIDGTFSEEGNNLNLLWGNHSNTIYYVGENSKNEYSITQDLTKIFKEQYSTVNVQEVLVVTTLLKVNS